MNDAWRIRNHERLQIASGLIDQVRDELPHEDPRRAELAGHRQRVWEIGYELVEGIDDRGEASDQEGDEHMELGGEG